MVVNTASYCAYTPQYADLQQLYSTYGGPTFEIIGFPCNDFGNQEPGNDDDIDSFCVQNYGITFQMMHKISITAPDTADVYKWLQLQSRNCVANAPVSWNFNKFLIDEAGNWIAHYSSPVSPLNQAIIDWILLPNTTGINERKNEPGIKILSNPVSDILRIHIETDKRTDVKISLLDIRGQWVTDIFSGNVLEEVPVTFPVNNLANGIYLLNARLEGIIKSYKIVVLR